MKHYRASTLTAAFLAVAAMALAATGPKDITSTKSATTIKSAHPIAPTRVLPRTETSHSLPPTAPKAVASTGYQIRWLSINSGGTIGAVSPNYKMNSSVGQAVTGKSTSPNYSLGIGFWYGAAGGASCLCPSQGDINADAVIDVFDVIGIIGIAFSGDPDPQDAGCPKTRGDVDNNGVTDVFDVIYLIATAFSGGADPVNPCAP